MPPFDDTAALAALKSQGFWIVPGHPEKSRFYLVSTFPDTQPGAMPPSGHAIPENDKEALRAWIAAGAPLPEGPALELKPRGQQPRSR